MGDENEQGARPASGNVRLPFEIDKSKTVTAEALTSLYHNSERGQQGAFPLGAAAQFHCGAHLLVKRNETICSIAHGEVVAARIGKGHGEHPWGDTGFVLLRHPLEGDKSIFSLFVHLQREPLHPDRTHAGWLRRLLLDDADSPIIAALRDGKVAILDADKKDGKRRWTVDASEPVGRAGEYLARPLLHWSVFSKEAVFPTGSLPEKEFGARDEVKLGKLDLSEERGDVEHTRKLIEALDPKKKTIGKMPHSIPMPGEVELFYRTPAECWRSRYLAVKGLAEFALDVEKFLQQERHKSHTKKEREEFKKNAQVFLFWKDLAKADDFPQDGKAIFVHPATALRLMRPRNELRLLYQIDPQATSAKDDTLLLEAEDGSWRHEIKVSGLTEVEPHWVELVFPNPPEGVRFNLLQDPGDGHPPLVVFKGVAYAELG